MHQNKPQPNTKIQLYRKDNDIIERDLIMLSSYETGLSIPLAPSFLRFRFRFCLPLCAL